MVVFITVLQFVATYQHIRRIAQIVPTSPRRLTIPSITGNLADDEASQPAGSQITRDEDNANVFKFLLFNSSLSRSFFSIYLLA